MCPKTGEQCHCRQDESDDMSHSVSRARLQPDNQTSGHTSALLQQRSAVAVRSDRRRSVYINSM